MVVKVGKKIGAFYRARRLLIGHALKMYLSSVIVPNFSYCCPLFACGVSASNCQQLETLEHREVRVRIGASKHESTRPLCALLGVKAVA